MFKIIYSFLVCFFIAAPVFAIENGDTVYVDYDLQGGVNNPNNITYFIYDYNTSTKYGLLPPTRKGYEFLGWYWTNNDNRLDINYKLSSLSSIDKPNHTPGNVLQIHARWGVVSKTPQQDESGCYLIHDAAELYGAVKVVENSYLRKRCMFIENDIVVNENLLTPDGNLNKGDFYWWEPFRSFYGVIEGNGHTISGLYGNVGLLLTNADLVIQNLGIVDSYFSGRDAGSFVSSVHSSLLLKNVFSTATVVATYGYVGGLVGFADLYGDPCLAVAHAPRSNAYAYTAPSSNFVVENSYAAGYLRGEEGGGLVGKMDMVSIKNSFFAGKIDVAKTFSGIGLQQKKSCVVLSEDATTFENVFYPENFPNNGFEATPVPASEFANGTVLEKLKNGTEIPIWTQDSGDAYPKLNGAYYDIRYYLNNGVNDPSNPAYYASQQEVMLMPATKEGDVFEGWFCDSIFTIPAENISSTTEGNLRLFAKWESGYSITYVNDGNYGPSAKTNPKYRYADSATFVLEEPIRDGATFEGWYTDSTFTTRVTELPHGNTEDFILIGKWNGREITMIYDLYGGTMGDSVNPEKVVNGDKIYLKNPTREGFVFRGWYDAVHSYTYLNSSFTAYSAKYDTIYLSAKWVFEAQKPAIDSNGCYMVTNVHELYFFNEFANSFLEEKPPVYACINIMNDIVVNDEISGLAPKYSRYNEMIEWEPLNGHDNPFVGIIYGNGHTINGLFMTSIIPEPDIFNGLIWNSEYEGWFPEVQDLYIASYYYKYEVYYEKLWINAMGNSGISRKIGISRKNPPVPLKMNHVRKYDIKGRSMKKHPNYGVFF